MDRDALPTEEESLLLTKQWLKRVALRRLSFVHGHRRRQRAAIHELPERREPFLGWRAIRIAMDRKEILRDSSVLSCVPLLSVNCASCSRCHLC